MTEQPDNPLATTPAMRRARRASAISSTSCATSCASCAGSAANRSTSRCRAGSTATSASTASGRTELVLRLERAFAGAPVHPGDRRSRDGARSPQRARRSATARARPGAAGCAGAGRAAALAAASVRRSKRAPWSRCSSGTWRTIPTGFTSRCSTTISRCSDVSPIASSPRPARRVAAGLIERDIVPGDRVALMLPTEPRFLHRLLRHPVRRRGAGADLSAGAAVADRGSSAPSGRHPAQCRRARPGDRAGGPAARGAAARAGRHAQVRGDRRAPVERHADRAAAGDRTARPPRSSNTPPAAPAIRRASCSATRNLVANVRLDGNRDQRDLGRRVRQLAAALSRPRPDRRLDGHAAISRVPLYVTSPFNFLVRPECWLKAIHRFRGTLSAAPNFAYELCLNRIPDSRAGGARPEHVARGLPTAPSRSASAPWSGSSRNSAATAFARSTMAPVYGLAENSVGVAFPPLGRGPLVERIDRDALMTRGRAELASPDDPNPLEVVACGHPLPDNEVRIVDELGREVGERVEGRLEFRGPSQTSGYFRNEAKSRELFHDGWVNSGDRAYMAGGDIFITGRVKDIIIRAGRNIYPHEVETAVGELPGMRKGGVAVFGATDAATGTERLVVMAETRETERGRARGAAGAGQRGRGRASWASRPTRSCWCAPRTVPKTSSGKVRRKLRQGALRARPARRTAERVLAADGAARCWPGSRPQIARLGRMAGNLLYAAWWWTVLVLTCAVGWLAGAGPAAPVEWRWAVVRSLARFFLFATGDAALGEGARARPARQRAHAVQSCELHGPAGARRGAARRAGLCRQEGVRQPAGRRHADAPARRAVRRALRSRGRTRRHRGRDRRRPRRAGSIVFFPEGTFTRRMGLSEFFLGAFKVASDAGLPVVPGVIRGTRTMLRGDQWLPRWSPDRDRDRRTDQAGRHRLLRPCSGCATRRAPPCWRAAASPTSAC